MLCNKTLKLAFLLTGSQINASGAKFGTNRDFSWHQRPAYKSVSEFHFFFTELQHTQIYVNH
jgi:hypothetical protein